MSTGTAMVTEPGVMHSLLAALVLPPGSVGSTQPAWLKALRAQALERTNALSLPSTHDEAWRFTPLANFSQQSFQPLRKPTQLQPGDIAHLQIAEANTRLVFVDGVHAPQLSSISPESGLSVGTLASMLATQPSSIEAHLGRQGAKHCCIFRPGFRNHLAVTRDLLIGQLIIHETLGVFELDYPRLDTLDIAHLPVLPDDRVLRMQNHGLWL